MRAIDADAIVYEPIDLSDTCRYERYYGTGILAVRKEDIDAMPTIEPERKKGKWNRDANGLVRCDTCGFSKERSDDRVYRFCPNCGTKMEEGENE